MTVAVSDLQVNGLLRPSAHGRCLDAHVETVVLKTASTFLQAGDDVSWVGKRPLRIQLACLPSQVKNAADAYFFWAG